jgi:hypothetical protein
MFKFRILIATGLVCMAAVFVSTSMLWAASKLTPKQQKAKSKCSLQFMKCLDGCGVVGLSLAYWPCQSKCESAYNRCMDSAGIPLQTNPPPKTGGRPTPTPAGKAPVPTPTPKRLPLSTKPIVNAPIASTPTPTPKKLRTPIKHPTSKQ